MIRTSRNNKNHKTSKVTCPRRTPIENHNFSQARCTPIFSTRTSNIVLWHQTLGRHISRYLTRFENATEIAGKAEERGRFRGSFYLAVSPTYSCSASRIKCPHEWSPTEYPEDFLLFQGPCAQCSPETIGVYSDRVH